MPELYPKILSGELRDEPLLVVDLPTGMGAGPELELLELRILELWGIADLFVVAESNHTFRGDLKPRLFQRNAERYKDFADRLLYLDLDSCGRYREKVALTREGHGKPGQPPGYRIEHAQRDCLWELLERERPDLPDNALMILSDLDEIPNAETLLAMKRCRLQGDSRQWAMSQRGIAFNLRNTARNSMQCYNSSTPWRQGQLLLLGLAREVVLQRNESMGLRLPNRVQTIVGAAMHLSNFGSGPALTVKGLQHVEYGGLYIPNSFDPCNATDEQVTEILQTFRDDPFSITMARKNSSNPVLRAAPRPGALLACRVPWALRANPQRYAAFWGT